MECCDPTIGLGFGPISSVLPQGSSHAGGSAGSRRLLEIGLVEFIDIADRAWSSSLHSFPSGHFADRQLQTRAAPDPRMRNELLQKAQRP